MILKQVKLFSFKIMRKNVKRSPKVLAFEFLLSNLFRVFMITMIIS